MDEQNNRNLLKQAIFDGISQRYEEELSATREFLIYSKTRNRKRRRKKLLLFALISLLALAVLVSSFVYLAGSVRGTVSRVTENGSAELDIMPQKILEEISVGDTVLVKVGSFEAEMPLVEKLIPEKGQWQLLLDKEAWSVQILSYGEDVCKTYGIRTGDRVTVRKSGQRPLDH